MRGGPARRARPLRRCGCLLEQRARPCAVSGSAAGEQGLGEVALGVRGERDPAARAIGRDRGLESVDRFVRSSGRRQGAAKRSRGRAGEPGSPHEHDHAVGERLQQRDDRGGALGVADRGARLGELGEPDQEVAVARHALEALGHRLVQQRACRVVVAELGEAEREVGPVRPPRRDRSRLAGSRGRTLQRLFDDVQRVLVRREDTVGVVVADARRLSVRLVREPSRRGKLAPVARDRRTPGRHVPRERGQPRLGGQPVIDPDLFVRRSDLARSSRSTTRQCRLCSSISGSPVRSPSATSSRRRQAGRSDAPAPNARRARP